MSKAQLRKAFIEEIILDINGDPTPNVRVRVPGIHTGLRKEDLPIAKPLGIPGVVIDKNTIIDQIGKSPFVYVLFDQGNLNHPYYLSLLVDLEPHEL